MSQSTSVGSLPRQRLPGQKARFEGKRPALLAFDIHPVDVCHRLVDMCIVSVNNIIPVNSTIHVHDTRPAPRSANDDDILAPSRRVVDVETEHHAYPSTYHSPVHRNGLGLVDRDVWMLTGRALSTWCASLSTQVPLSPDAFCLSTCTYPNDSHSTCVALQYRQFCPACRHPDLAFQHGMYFPGARRELGRVLG